MKLNKLIAVAVLASCATSAFAMTTDEDLTSSDQTLVKNNFGECVTVKANRNLKNCGAAKMAKDVMVKEAEETMEMGKELVTLSANAYFDFDKATLKTQGKASIQKLARELNQRGANIKKITVVGNTDSKGSEAYNQKLSERRAAAVGNYLIENGVPASLLEAYGNGERNPVASNATAEGRAQNRRVDISIEGFVSKPVGKMSR